MAKTIDYINFYIPITPYKVDGVSDTYDTLSVSVAYRKGKGFVSYYRPGWSTSFGGWGCIIMGSNPLTSCSTMLVKKASRNNAKELSVMKAALELAQEPIRWLFDHRKFEALGKLIVMVCKYGYTEQIKTAVLETIAEAEARTKSNSGNQKSEAVVLTPIMRQYYDIKKKHPDRLLLFRCGDFYETYNDDAKVCAEVLGITLTFRDLGEHVPMAGFPYHALDGYLPRLIRAGHRVAICDQLEDPKLTKKQSTNNNETTMKLTINNQNESANVQNAQVNNAIEPVKVAAGSKPMTAEQYMEEPIEDAEVVEEAPAPTEEKPKVTLKKKQAEKEPAQTLPKVTFGTYKTKKGDTAPQIIGFAGEDDPRWKAHKDAGHKYVSCSSRNDINGEKVYILLFGVRYMDVAKALAGAYNTNDVDAWHRAEDACMAIYEQAQRDGKARWEEKKAQWKQKADEKKAAKEQAKCYKPEEVAAMLTSMLNGGDLPEEIKKLMKAA